MSLLHHPPPASSMTCDPLLQPHARTDSYAIIRPDMRLQTQIP